MANSWKDIGFVIKSKNRLKVLELLNEKPQNPTSLARLLDNHRSSISKIVGELSGRGLIECLTPDDKTFRIYHITSRGKHILSETKKHEFPYTEKKP
jgi:DNA-binding MarR family transcriptional regulator